MRLLILSNRLQVTASEDKNSITVKPSSGGLVTGLSSYLDSLKDKNYIWIGWPGSSTFSDPENLRKILYEKYNSWPVVIEEKIMDLFYNGFCNKTIWPLFHYFPFLTVFDEKMWEIYKEVNSLFANEVLKIIQKDDILWIHDYHLMLVPKLIKEKYPDISIGFFLHIPFPSYELFRLLPRKWGKDILNGLLEADLVGFHTYDYSHYFLRCVLRILGFNHNLGVIHLNHKITKVSTFPMGIDYKKYNNAVNLTNVKNEKTLLKRKLQNLKIIFSVDRQDYTKGILNRLEGYELFLKKNQNWHGKVVFIMVIVPSRIGVEDYQKAKNSINQIIGDINGIYGNIHWTPIIYQYRAISFEKLVALYNISDVGLITPLRDGMNLVAKEFVAAQKEKKGVLVLSEMAGAAMELGEAVIVNPYHREDISDAIKVALEMPSDEKTKRITSMQERLKNLDIKIWANNFFNELEHSMEIQKKYGASLLEGLELKNLHNKYHNASKKILFLDYDGTLVPFAKNPSKAAPDRKISRLIKLFSENNNIDIIIISGRNKQNLQDWYGKYDVTLVAEHGVWIKKPHGEWFLTKQLNNEWKPRIIQIMETYKARLPDSFIEEKDFSIAWHYRNSDSSLSDLRIKEFVDDMVQFTAQNEIEILMGHKVVEIKCSGINKGEAAKMLLSDQNYDFVMAAGDDVTDELLFQALPKESFSIKIGKYKSFAHYNLNSSFELVKLLEKIIDYKKDFIQYILDIFKKQ